MVITVVRGQVYGQHLQFDTMLVARSIWHCLVAYAALAAVPLIPTRHRSFSPSGMGRSLRWRLGWILVYGYAL